MYGAPYIFHFFHPYVKTAEMMVQRVNFERNLKNICPCDGILLVALYYLKTRDLPGDALVTSFIMMYG